MTQFESRGGNLYIDGKKVIRGWESFTGWYWFATEKVRTQDSLLDEGKVAKNDTIWYGLVQGFVEEWGEFSEAEINQSMKEGMVWEINKKDLLYAGRRR